MVPRSCRDHAEIVLARDAPLVVLAAPQACARARARTRTSTQVLNQMAAESATGAVDGILATAGVHGGSLAGDAGADLLAQAGSEASVLR
mgnify:CR=1 FL=1